MIEENLLNYGAIGIFCIYLIYDRQVLMKKITKALEELSKAIRLCPLNR